MAERKKKKSDGLPPGLIGGAVAGVVTGRLAGMRGGGRLAILGGVGATLGAVTVRMLSGEQKAPATRAPATRAPATNKKPDGGGAVGPTFMGLGLAGAVASAVELRRAARFTAEAKRQTAMAKAGSQIGDGAWRAAAQARKAARAPRMTGRLGMAASLGLMALGAIDMAPAANAAAPRKAGGRAHLGGAAKQKAAARPAPKRSRGSTAAPGQSRVTYTTKDGRSVTTTKARAAAYRRRRRR